MSQPKNTPRDDAFEKFPKPRTFPSHWDTSEMMAAEAASPAADDDRMETFPKPRTIPGKWDVSGFKK